MFGFPDSPYMQHNLMLDSCSNMKVMTAYPFAM